MITKQAEDLSDYVRRLVSEQKLSYRELEARANRKGFRISNGYISRIISRAVDNPSVNKLRALAAGLNRPEEEVFAIARGEKLSEEGLQDALAKIAFAKYSKASKKKKAEIQPLIEFLISKLEDQSEKN